MPSEEDDLRWKTTFEVDQNGPFPDHFGTPRWIFWIKQVAGCSRLCGVPCVAGNDRAPPSELGGSGLSTLKIGSWVPSLLLFLEGDKIDVVY